MSTTPDLPIFSELYPRLNSPDYYSIYPPLCQAIFGLITWLCGSNVFWASVMLKLLFIAAEAGTIYTLMKFVQQLGLPLKRVLLYALNPLIIVELCGNLHFEAIMIFLLITALWFFARKRYLAFGVLMGLSILTKLLPLMFLPFFVRRTNAPMLLKSFGVIGVTILVGFLPFIDPIFLEKFGSSIDLYFRKFEFNASIYYLARQVGYWHRGFNMIATIGPWLSLVTVIIIGLMALVERNTSIQSLIKHCLLAMTAYLLLATTVHPWYTSLLVVLCIFTRFRYPLFWSGLITLTYINYWGGVYHERLGVVILEYTLVLILLYLELFRVPMVKRLALKFLKLFRSIRPRSSSVQDK